MRLLGVLCAIALFCSGLSAGQAADPIKEAGAALFAKTGAVGMVMVVVRGGAATVHGYGETARGSKETPDGASLVRIGSISKVLATDVMLALAAEGKLQPADPV